jgi:ribulose-5-phosphate 4-epimerase/fuculose-1-phosphate aldolase
MLDLESQEGRKMTAELEELKERLAVACRVLGRLDLTKAATGHASVRFHDTGTFLIRGRGPDEVGVRYTTSEEIMQVDMAGKPVEGTRAGLRAPLEIFIHSEIYRARTDVQSVVHMHPPHVVAATTCGYRLTPIYGAYDPRSAQLAIDGIPVFERSVLIDSTVLGQEVAAALGNAYACLMRGHGVTTAATNIEDAALTMIYINELATMHYNAKVFGEPREIANSDKEKIAAIERGPETSVPSARSLALWRYYRRVTDA